MFSLIVRDDTETRYLKKTLAMIKFLTITFNKQEVIKRYLFSKIVSATPVMQCRRGGRIKGRALGRVHYTA